uniref:zinc transporter ZIP13-like n=1 Tax=Styela clava TaxID=7725 RepID=UPI00193AA830|nr:zinc transporter ZIP13-like [Styela clava]
MMLWAVLMLVLVQSSYCIIGIHRTNTLKPTCDNTEWVKSENGNVHELSENCAYVLSSVESNVQMETFYETWFLKYESLIYSIISAFMVGLSGILPLIMLPKMSDGSKCLNRLLSFAVGGLLGDVFLHLLPESWNALLMSESDHKRFHTAAVFNGFWVLVGLIFFWTLEKMFSKESEATEEVKPTSNVSNGDISHQNCNGNNNTKEWNIEEKDCCCGDDKLIVQNGVHKVRSDVKGHSDIAQSKSNVKMAGYLNLLANIIDNFTHGLAIGGSYRVGRWVGILTTLAILLHEIPHELGDFAILLRAGFDRWHAAKMQLMTATGGLFGAAFAHIVGANTTWGICILPFTSGGFLYIALCTVVPDLLKEKSPKESFYQFLLLCLAIGIMGLVSIIE